MATPRNTDTTKLNNGEMYYFGIEEKIISKLERGLKSNVSKILLQVNIDGLPIFENSLLDFYPILGLCKEFIDETPFTIAIFCGRSKPDPLEKYLEDFIAEVKSLRLKCKSHEGKNYSFDINFFICDAPARAFLKQTFGHTSTLGCERCNIIGKRLNNRINFADNPINNYPKKLYSDFYLNERKEYIKNYSPLLQLNIGLVSQFPIDPMHLIYLGVAKRLLINYYLEGKARYRLSQKNIRKINETILKIKEFIPSEFARKPRSFKDIKRWKATEFRLFVMYTGPIILWNIIHDTYYSHFILLHCATFILSNEYFIKNYLSTAEDCLRKFFLTFTVYCI
nr:PREDICTED: uncharacterized protein LOC107399041 [Tribolium castaneum]|eukprot:XP_015840165.1 PREDICTED: uncharacterized protein LOC107399041 [Tribolium castaneum]